MQINKILGNYKYHFDKGILFKILKKIIGYFSKLIKNDEFI